MVRRLTANAIVIPVRNYSRAYLRHLYVSGEILAMVLNTIHNLRYYLRLMERIREAIREGRYRGVPGPFSPGAEGQRYRRLSEAEIG